MRKKSLSTILVYDSSFPCTCIYKKT